MCTEKFNLVAGGYDADTSEKVALNSTVVTGRN